MRVKIYHNPRCSKSRQALQLLKDQGVEVDIIEYIKTPPSLEELEDVLHKLNIEPRQLMRKKEAEYQAHNLDGQHVDRLTLLTYMIKYPNLIERPIVITDDKAVIGRPPEAVLDILK